MHYQYCYAYISPIHTASPPSFIEQPKHTRVNFYESATLSCAVQAFGYTQVAWKKTGSILPITATVNNTVSLNGVASVLTITGTSGYYKGLYYCIASNEVGETVSKAALLRVTGKIINAKRVTIRSQNNQVCIMLLLSLLCAQLMQYSIYF